MNNVFSGACCTPSDPVLSVETLTRCCNVGHARASCRTAATADADSIRLLVISDDGNFIEIAWATELNHHPVEVGTLRISRMATPVATPLDYQARACASTYLRQTGQL